MWKGECLSIVCVLFRCGKTSVCQLYADVRGIPLHSVNCHLHTEASDFIGGLRPIRNKTNVRTIIITSTFYPIDLICLYKN